MNRTIFAVDLTTDGDNMDYKVGWTDSLTNEEWIGLFEVFMEFVNETPERQEQFMVAMLHLAEKKTGRDLIGEMLGVDINAVS